MVYRKTSKVERKDVNNWNDIDGWYANEYTPEFCGNFSDTATCIDALGKKEDIEIEIGLSLEDIHEILTAPNIYDNKGKRYDNSNSLSYFGNSWLIYNASAKKCFKPSEYGRTWALTKEELAWRNRL